MEAAVNPRCPWRRSSKRSLKAVKMRTAQPSQTSSLRRQRAPHQARASAAAHATSVRITATCSTPGRTPTAVIRTRIQTRSAALASKARAQEEHTEHPAPPCLQAGTGHARITENREDTDDRKNPAGAVGDWPTGRRAIYTNKPEERAAAASRARLWNWSVSRAPLPARPTYARAARPVHRGCYSSDPADRQVALAPNTASPSVSLPLERDSRLRQCRAHRLRAFSLRVEWRE